MLALWNAKLIPLGRSIFPWGAAYSSGVRNSDQELCALLDDMTALHYKPISNSPRTELAVELAVLSNRVNLCVLCLPRLPCSSGRWYWGRWGPSYWGERQKNPLR